MKKDKDKKNKKDTFNKIKGDEICDKSKKRDDLSERKRESFEK